MVPNFQTASSPTSTMHIKWGCFIFTGDSEAFLHWVRPLLLQSARHFRPGTRPQAMWDRSVPVHFMAESFSANAFRPAWEKKALQRSRMRYDEICKMCLQAFNLFSTSFHRFSGFNHLLAGKQRRNSREDDFPFGSQLDRSESSLCQALQMATVICGIIGPGSWANGEPLP